MIKGVSENNIYNLSGCADSDSLEQWVEKINSWLTRVYGAYMDIIPYTYTVTGNNIPICDFYMYFKNTGLGIYFTVCKTDSISSSYYQVGYLYGKNVKIAYSDSGITASNKTLCLYTLFAGDKLFVIPGCSATGNNMCAFCKYTDNENLAILHTKNDEIYVSRDNGYLLIKNAMSKRSGIDKKYLMPYAVPTMDIMYSDVLKSDGMVVQNYAVYQLGDRYFIDFPINNTEQCFTLELFQED